MLSDGAWHMPNACLDASVRYAPELGLSDGTKALGVPLAELKTFLPEVHSIVLENQKIKAG